MEEAWVQLSDQRYPYRFSRSKRAKYLRLKLAHSGELSVVVPPKVSLNEARAFVDSQAPWLESKLPTLDITEYAPRPNPSQLDLKYLDECWSIDYQSKDKVNAIYITPQPEGLVLSCTGLLSNRDLLNKALGKWLKIKAERVIPQRLSLLAERHGFHYRQVTIRGQKTRWGSCSSQKNISLNYKLLFLPENMVDYVLIHELCHTVEMNHSSRFWALVADCDKNYQQHDKALNEYSKIIPV